MMAAMPRYKRNFFVLWFGNFFTGIGISLVTPFLPLYIDTLGEFSRQELAVYSGIIIAAPFLSQALISPVWGRLADRSGRKPMLLRAGLGMAVIMTITGFAADVWTLMAVRTLFGLFSGFISNAVTLIAVQTPKNESGKTLGALNTANVGGMLIGPIFGGTMVALIGYARVFFVTGGILGMVFILTLLMVKEDFTPVRKRAQDSVKQIFSLVKNPQIIIGMFLTTLIVMMTVSSINPILPLYVRDLLPPDGNVEFWSGIVAAAPGFVTVFAAPCLGALGDRIGTQKILMFGLTVQVVVFLPMAFVATVGQLVALRLISGLATASLMPGVHALLVRNSPKEAAGRIFSYNQSAQSTGMVAGPLAGGAVSSVLNFHYVFFAAAAFAFINLMNVMRISRKDKNRV